MAVATDAHNNVIVVGFFTGTITLGADTLVNPDSNNSTFDIFVVKYSATGAYLWSKRFGDSAASAFQTQRAWAVATDSHDDIFITATSIHLERAAILSRLVAQRRHWLLRRPLSTSPNSAAAMATASGRSRGAAPITATSARGSPSTPRTMSW